MDLYISADIEADGPIPGTYSMLSFGLAAAGVFDGTTFEPFDPSEATFYRELKPISERFDADALKASGLDRDRLALTGGDPTQAMQEAAKWVTVRSSPNLRPVLVAYPLGFDWMFLHWYFIKFLGESPFGFSSALDMKSIYQQKARVTIDRAGRRDLPENLRSTQRHTHNALDDAIEQAEVFSNLFIWEGKRG